MSAKTRTEYVCQQCGARSPKMMGRCPNCQQWNTYVEEISVARTSAGGKGSGARGGPGILSASARAARLVPLGQVPRRDVPRLVTPDQELNRVLGGGLVAGSVVLLGGEPGIGKSTLLLQLALDLGTRKVLYVSGEESAEQIKMRADRIAPARETDTYLLTETDTDTIIAQAGTLLPDLLVIDSIQTLELSGLESAAGSVAQVRESAAALTRFAKESGVPVVLVGHITKEGALAGPKVLEHMVDTVLQFEGDRHMAYRLLRTIKNRFGSTAELGIYEMAGEGLRPVSNPSEILVPQRDEDLSGFTIGVTLEGNRPLLIEVQALVSTASYGTPQRTANGFDTRRLQMLLAVLEKRCGLRMGTQDVFLNIAGGLRIEDPALDLAVCLSIVSSYTDRPVSSRLVVAGEVGLGGEIRTVGRQEARIAEAARLGYERMLISGYGKTRATSGTGANAAGRGAGRKAAGAPLTLLEANRLTEALPMIFGSLK